jgi:hypothetical protein
MKAEVRMNLWRGLAAVGLIVLTHCKFRVDVTTSSSLKVHKGRPDALRFGNDSMQWRGRELTSAGCADGVYLRVTPNVPIRQRIASNCSSYLATLFVLIRSDFTKSL